MNIKLIFLYLILLEQIYSYIGNSCKVLIQEHFFDLNSLTNENDYEINFLQDNQQFTFYFNFCSYINHSCNDNKPSYHLVQKSVDKCVYFRESPEQNSIQLIKINNQQGLQMKFDDVLENGESVIFQLLCNRQEQQILIKDIQIQDQNFIIEIQSKQICSQELNQAIFDFIAKFKWIIFILGIVIGPLEVFVGEKIFGITVFIMSFISSIIILLIIADVFFIFDESSKLWVSFVLFMVFFLSIVIAFILLKLKEIEIMICGMTTGIFICILLNQILFWKIVSQPSWIFFYNAMIIFAIFGAILSYEFRDHIVIIATSLIGSYITVRSYSLVFGGFPNEMSLNQDIINNNLEKIPLSYYIYLVLILGLFSYGMVFQFRRRNQNLEMIIKNENLFEIIKTTDDRIVNLNNQPFFLMKQIKYKRNFFKIMKQLSRIDFVYSCQQFRKKYLQETYFKIIQNTGPIISYTFWQNIFYIQLMFFIMFIKIKNVSNTKIKLLKIKTNNFFLFIDSTSYLNYIPKQNLQSQQISFSELKEVILNSLHDVNSFSQNYYVFSCEFFSYVYLELEQEFIKKNIRLLSTTILINEFIIQKISFQIFQKNIFIQEYQKLEEENDVKLYKTCQYDEEILLSSNIILTLKSNGLISGGFYLQLKFFNKILIFYKNHFNSKELLNYQYQQIPYCDYFFILDQLNNQVINNREQNFINKIQEIETQYKNTNVYVSVMKNMNLVEIIFLLKRRNPNIRIILIGNFLRSILMRTLTNLEFINKQFSQMILFRTPQHYLDVPFYLQQKTLFIYDNVKEFSQQLLDDSEFFRSNKFVVFSNQFANPQVKNIFQQISKIQEINFIDQEYLEGCNYEEIKQIIKAKNIFSFINQKDQQIKVIEIGKQINIKQKGFYHEFIKENQQIFLLKKFSKYIDQKIFKQKEIKKIKIDPKQLIENYQQKLKQNNIEQIGINEYLDKDLFQSFKIQQKNQLLIVETKSDVIFQKIFEILSKQ